MWFVTPVILELGELRQMNCGFEASMSYIVSSRFGLENRT